MDLEEEDVRRWMEDATSSSIQTFPFENLASCSLEDLNGHKFPFESIDEKTEGKRTILMFGRNLL